MKQVVALRAHLKENSCFDKLSIWKDERLYINDFGEKISCVIFFDDPEREDFEYPFQGCSLKVFVNDGAKRVDMAKQTKHEIMLEIKKSGAVPASFTVCDNWEDVAL